MQTRSTSATRIVALVVVAAAGFALVWVELTVLLGLIAVAVALFLLPVGDWLVLPFFAVLTGAAVAMNEHPVSIGGYSFYGADAVLLLMLSLPVVRWLKPEGTRSPEPCGAPPKLGVPRAYTAYFCWGILALAMTLVLRDHRINDVLGAYRRIFFYSLAFPLVLLMPLDRRHLRLVPAALWTAFLLVAAMGLYRLATGQTWREHQFVIMANIPSPRLLSYTECITLAMSLAYFAAILRTPGSRFGKLMAVPGAALAMVLLLMSGYRVSAVLALAVPLLALAGAAWIRRERLKGLFNVCVFGTLLLACGAAAAIYVFPHAFTDAWEQFVDRVASFSLKDDMRYYAWQEAWRQFSARPLLGAGLGQVLVYPFRASDGLFHWYRSSTHNTLLTVLYQTGVPGFLLFCAFHVAWIRRVFRGLRRDTTADAAPVVAMLALYCCALGFSMLQPLAVGSIIALYMSMGLTLHLLASTGKPQVEGGADASWE